jgi:hypothetical protein
MRHNLRLFIAGGMLVAIGMAVFIGPFATGTPDGLKRVAIDKGFSDSERDHDLGESPVAGYEVKGVRDERIATAASGLIGVLVTFGAGVAVFAAVRALRDKDGASKAGDGT